MFGLPSRSASRMAVPGRQEKAWNFPCHAVANPSAMAMPSSAKSRAGPRKGLRGTPPLDDVERRLEPEPELGRRVGPGPPMPSDFPSRGVGVVHVAECLGLIERLGVPVTREESGKLVAT